MVDGNVAERVNAGLTAVGSLKNPSNGIAYLCIMFAFLCIISAYLVYETNLPIYFPGVYPRGMFDD